MIEGFITYKLIQVTRLPRLKYKQVVDTRAHYGITYNFSYFTHRSKYKTARLNNNGNFDGKYMHVVGKLRVLPFSFIANLEGVRNESKLTIEVHMDWTNNIVYCIYRETSYNSALAGVAVSLIIECASMIYKLTLQKQQGAYVHVPAYIIQVTHLSYLLLNPPNLSCISSLYLFNYLLSM